MRQTIVRRRLAALLALIVVVSGLTVTGAAPASATPHLLRAPGDSGDDGEGGSKAVVDRLEAASRGFVEARDALAQAKTRQREFGEKLKQLDAELGPKQAALDEVAGQAYRTGRLGAMSALFSADSSAGFLDRTETLAVIAAKQEQALRDLKATRQAQQQAKTAIDVTVRDQQKQVNLMAKRKKQAEDALKAGERGWRRRRPRRRQQRRCPSPARPERFRWLHGRRPHHLRVHHTATVARAQAGEERRVHPLRGLLPPAEQRRAPQGPGLRLRR